MATLRCRRLDYRCYGVSRDLVIGVCAHLATNRAGLVAADPGHADYADGGDGRLWITEGAAPHRLASGWEPSRYGTLPPDLAAASELPQRTLGGRGATRPAA